MSTDQARRLEQALLRVRGAPRAQALHDQLWLRTALTEQWRRVPRSEREAFERRADRVLEKCWLGATEFHKRRRGEAAIAPRAQEG